MNGGSGSGLLAELVDVKGELNAWRGLSRKRQKIPEAIWVKAVRAAKRHGLNPVSKALGLDYSCLKRRVHESGGSSGSTLTPAFVEVKSAHAEDLACVIELEKGGGARMRICVKSAGSVDWCRIKEAFLGA